MFAIETFLYHKFSKERITLKKDYLNRIKEKNRTEEPIMIAIDGMAASGKTTFANWLHLQCESTLIHMDDFFLQPYQRTKKRLTEPGGNIDYERVEPVLKSLKRNKKAILQAYDCSLQKFKEEVWIEAKEIIIIEGSYSLHPLFQPYYDLKLFFKCDIETQQGRIKARNGEELLARFNSEWIPMETIYFDTFDIQNKSDIKVDNSDKKTSPI